LRVRARACVRGREGAKREGRKTEGLKREGREHTEEGGAKSPFSRARVPQVHDMDGAQAHNVGGAVAGIHLT
jgi:hypothetical protein